jgi:pimeloyl-ACP methyl ester carboxylesterase
VRALALHGLPTSPRLWERLDLPGDWQVNAPHVPGLGDDGTPSDWRLSQCASQLQHHAQDADVLIGHDLGGVLCAMLAQPGQRVVLSGTALGLYWWAIRATALPGLQRWFYQRHGGRHFLSKGASAPHRESLLAAFSDHGQDWPDRMRTIAKAMQPPKGLAQRLQACDVQLIWGQQDPWYPRSVAQSLRRSTGGTLHWLPCGHFAPWECADGFSKILLDTD